MSVTTYDSSFSYRQDQVARLGDRAKERQPMSADERRKFESSPFMQKMKEIDDKCWQKFTDRDRKRAQRDKNFRPQDTDFEAPKAHKYDKTINYYKVLGIDDLASNDEVKKAYRKLSLTYHPDKQQNKTQEEKDESAAIFMEIKNAYKTLADDPTRRQYDFERERDAVSHETHGKKVQEKASFDAIKALVKLAEVMKDKQKPAGEIVKVPVMCRLEKFVYGGYKAIKRSRQIKDKQFGGYVDELKVFRCDLPAGAAQPWQQEFRRQGDHHEETEPDTLKFVFSAKAHPVVDRVGQDLRVRQTVALGDGLQAEPYLSAEVPSIGGRHYLLWGRNPFFGAEDAETGEVHIRIQGQGVSQAGSLSLTLAMGLKSALANSARSGDVGSANQVSKPSAKPFLERFGLGPPWGFTDGEASPSFSSSGGSHGSTSAAPAMRRRISRQRQPKRHCELEMAPLGEPAELHTKPHSSMRFFSSSLASGAVGPIFALGLSCPPGGKKKGSREWEALKQRLLPLLQRSGFHLLAEARAIRPKRLTRLPAFPDVMPLPRSAVPAYPWKQLGDEAFARGDFWRGVASYSARLKELGVEESENDGEEEEEKAPPPEGEEEGQLPAAAAAEASSAAGRRIPEVAKLLSNRAACFAKLGDFASSLADAKRAAKVAPGWSKPWSRIGIAAWHMDEKVQKEAKGAYLKAVELEPSTENVAALRRAVSRLDGCSPELAHAMKEEGNEAYRGSQFGLAVAHYTSCIARLPEVILGDGTDQREDEHGLLRGVLFANRSAAFTRLRSWEAAVADGRAAVAAQPGLTAARIQLGVALLGKGLHQEAYIEFSKGLQMDEENKGAQRGRSACLKELVLWRSATDKLRFNNRFWLDWHRPRTSTRIFALSDIHFEQKYNEDWVHAIDDFAFQDDVLIVAGNVAPNKNGLERGLMALKQKFRRVFFTVGNHDVQIGHHEHARYPDSMAKLFAIINMCDELSVDVFPAPVAEGLMVMPLLSWHNADFDLADPFPDPNSHFDRFCKWPMDADSQVWKYMVKLNEPFLKIGHQGTLITFSHWLPRQGLPFDKTKKNAIKAVGCEMIDEQARAVGSKLHVFGHSRTKYAQIHSGIRYVHNFLGFETDWPRDDHRRLMMVYDGKSLCMQEWGADNEPPLGYVKRILQTAFYIMPGLREGADLRKARSLVEKFNTFTGIEASFDHLGSKKKEKETFIKETWPDLATLSCEATHGLVVVAEDLEVLKVFLSSKEYKEEWNSLTHAHAQNTVIFHSPLGVDLAYQKRPDPTLIIYALRLKPTVTNDSEDYNKIDKAVEAINKLPGIEGKIAVSLHPTGFGKLSTRELLDEVDVVQDQSLGATHIFTVVVDDPSSFKMLSVSKTFGKWRSAVEPLLQRASRAGPALLGFASPLEIAASAAAPKKEKKKAPPAAPAKPTGVATGRR